jgi:hypothetical protein
LLCFIHNNRAQAVIHWAEEGTRAEVAGRVMAAILPWALSHNHTLRTFTQIVLRHLLHHFPQLNCASDGAWNPDCSAVLLLPYFFEFPSANEEIGCKFCVI